MITNDYRLNNHAISLLRGLIHKKLDYYRADPFVFNNAVFENVSFFVASGIYQLTAPLVTLDYYGSVEDISILEFDSCLLKDVGSSLMNTEQIDVHVNDEIKAILVVNEVQQAFRNNSLFQELMQTRGLIFQFKDHELSFEKEREFSQDIYINRGSNLLDKFLPVDWFSEGWHTNEKGVCTREIITLQ